MDMGVIIETPGMRMKNHGHADVGAKVFGIGAKVFQRADSASKEKMINEALVIPDEGSELLGKREGCHEVLNR
jgi:hypothetical protein